MTDPRAQAFQDVVRRFPKADRDPYQRAARDAIIKIMHAGQNADDALKVLGAAVRAFLADPPLSLAYNTPRREAENAAKQLAACLRELNQGAKVLAGLRSYVEQFESQG